MAKDGEIISEEEILILETIMQEKNLVVIPANYKGVPCNVLSKVTEKGEVCPLAILATADLLADLTPTIKG